VCRPVGSEDGRKNTKNGTRSVPTALRAVNGYDFFTGTGQS
jgi:hypothetical protein